MYNPIARLYNNPWQHILSDGVVMQSLVSAAAAGSGHLRRLTEAGQIADRQLDNGLASFGFVVMRPTRPRGDDYADLIDELTPDQQFLDQLVGAVLMGPRGEDLLPNGAAKADIRFRYPGADNDMVTANIHCLSPGDFAWDGSVEYRHTPAGGSGLSADQDYELSLLMVTSFIDGIRAKLARWLADKRKLGSHGWFDPDNNPAIRYTEIHAMPCHEFDPAAE